MKLNKYNFLVFLILLPDFAYSHWSQEAQEWGTELNSKTPAFENSLVSTTWGGIHRYKNKLTVPYTYAYREVDLESKLFESGKVPTLSYLQWQSALLPSAANTAKNAPLIVFLPGIFGSIWSPSSLKTIVDYSKRGYHVLVIPNPYSVEYLKEKPKYPLGTIEKDAEVVLNLIQNFRSKIGKEKITRIELIGESFGAFLSSVVIAGDNKKIISRTTLISPPLNMRISLEKFDNLLESTKKDYFEKCSQWDYYTFIIFNILWSRNDVTLKPYTIECSGATLAWSGFQNFLTDSAEVLFKDLKVGEIPDPSQNHEKYLKWKNNFNFKKFAESFINPKNNPLSDSKLANANERGDLRYWLKKSEISKNNSENFRIISAKDDFINNQSDWKTPQSKSVFTSKNLLLLNSGGHTGFVDLDEYQNLIDISF